MRQKIVTPLIYIFRINRNTKYIHTYMYHELASYIHHVSIASKLYAEVHAVKVISMTSMMSTSKNITGKTISSAIMS